MVQQRLSADILYAAVPSLLTESALGLPQLPLSTRAYYERNLFERHWSVGHNRSKKARTDADRKLLGLLQALLYGHLPGA